MCGDVEEREHSCLHTNTEVKYAKSATCGNNGHTGDTYCLDCGERVKTGRLILPFGEHSYGEWVSGATADIEKRECSVCHTVETRATESAPANPVNRILSVISAPSAAQPSANFFGVIFNAFGVAMIVTAAAALVILSIAVVVKIRED